jgi:hypothetical protein
MNRIIKYFKTKYLDFKTGFWDFLTKRKIKIIKFLTILTFIGIFLFFSFELSTQMKIEEKKIIIESINLKTLKFHKYADIDDFMNRSISCTSSKPEIVLLWHKTGQIWIDDSSYINMYYNIIRWNTIRSNRS